MVSLPAFVFCLPCHPSMWQIFAGLPRASLLQYLATCVPAVQCCMVSLPSCLMCLTSLPLYYDNNRSAKHTTLHAQDWVKKGLEPTSVAYVYPLSCEVMHGEHIASHCYLSSLSIGTIFICGVLKEEVDQRILRGCSFIPRYADLEWNTLQANITLLWCSLACSGQMARFAARHPGCWCKRALRLPSTSSSKSEQSPSSSVTP